MTNGLKERFYHELGREIGTSADARIWANAFGCDVICADKIIKELVAEGRARTRTVDGEERLYRG